VFAAGGAPAMAQGVGSSGGTVADPSEAVLPGVTVTIRLDNGDWQRSSGGHERTGQLSAHPAGAGQTGPERGVL